VKIEIFLSSVPPSVVLGDAEDFASLSVLVHDADHVWIDPNMLIALAGELGESETWRSHLDEMLDVAGHFGWVDSDGSVRAHVEHPS
jgi:hypothetical protein